MTSIIKKSATLLIILLFTSQAMAIVQFRGHYGLGQPDGYQNSSQSVDTSALGADVIISLPLIPIIFGLRYENITSDEDFGAINDEIDLNRIAILGGYRIIDTLLFIGVLGSFGIINDGEVTRTLAGVETTTEIDMSTSLTVAVEGGVKLNDFILGLELGYMHGEDKDNNFDYDGTYAKALLGYEF